MNGPNSTLARSAALSAVTLLTSSATLICCVLPAVLVALGAGAALAGLISAVPQLIWLSELKLLVFGVAGVLLTLSGAVLWRGRKLPCPIDATAALACQRLRRLSACLYTLALVSFLVGGFFAFVLPLFNA